MTTLAIGLNDAAIAIARSDGLLVAEPGVALTSGDRIALAGFSEGARLIPVNDDGP